MDQQKSAWPVKQFEIYKVYIITTETAESTRPTSLQSLQKLQYLQGLQVYMLYRSTKSTDLFTFTTESADNCQVYWLYTKPLGLPMPGLLSRNQQSYCCFTTFDPPFNHAWAQHGVCQADLCGYSDILKELVYILFQDQSLWEKIFSQLGLPSPDTLSLYKQYIMKAKDGELIDTYKFVDAYLDARGGLV